MLNQLTSWCEGKSVPKHIAVDLRALTTPHPTGVATYTRELLTGIFELDKENHYYLFTNSSQIIPPNHFPWQADNLHYLHTPWPNKVFNASLALGFPKLDRYIIENWKLEIGNFDIWFSPNLNFTSLSKNTKHLLTIHDLSFELFPEFFSPKQRLWHRALQPKKQCQRADLILAVSENTKRDLIDYYKIKENKIKVLYPGLSPQFTNHSLISNFQFPISKTTEAEKTKPIETLKKKYHLPDNYILFVGSLEPRKNILGLITAFELFSTNRLRTEDYVLRTKDYHLVLAGPPGYQYHQIQTKINQSPYKNRIHLFGYIDEADKPALYQAAALFVYPSFYEGFGFPVLEAMSQGTPVITSNRSSLPEITGSGAWLVNPHKPAEIATGMITILTNEPIKNRLIDNGQKRTASFQWKNAATEWLQLIKKI